MKKVGSGKPKIQAQRHRWKKVTGNKGGEVFTKELGGEKTQTALAKKSSMDHKKKCKPVERKP